MPIVTLTTIQGAPAALIDGLLEQIHAALVASGVPPTDRFHRVLELPPGALRVDPSYPDLKQSRTARFMLVEITLSVGRSVKVKRQIAEAIAAGAVKLGLSPEDIMIHFQETRWENWSFAGGRLLHG